MEHYIISASSRSRDLTPIMIAVHDLIGRLPVTARSRDHPGVRIEDGQVIDEAYTGPVLEEVLAENVMKKVRPPGGPYKGIPVAVAPVRDSEGRAIGAIGIVDVTGIFDLAGFMEQNTEIRRQVCGEDPCPLPTESPAAKR
ncbi:MULTISPECIES: DUF2111 domain-containing protein [unclassified Methanoculleus]|uniref:DUF2111 domain-containing protein n=1 Tax=unclassified Methanoculleus TaxID=2619537 RepID=UPI0025FDAE5D|nr:MULTISPECIES: DUF2111 domain-containing protein [unclassified Methanoculleus]MCK9318567.1 DUF2111 domain-containing protein [Methanoculleus sp.]MDD2253124.1 DUF2111 domain-containing protein [Methanoculleus sp.]MDD2788321.1 DUF2111 domain-containing protein [Methanoculleus sp.]MDD3216961.1 DUF2111 domain-containing protein [Methanoculleus sp.]MDD4313328.1 DUF2111 domain-containing protein [Methanoculleus sp.]